MSSILSKDRFLLEKASTSLSISKFTSLNLVKGLITVNIIKIPMIKSTYLFIFPFGMIISIKAIIIKRVTSSFSQLLINSVKISLTYLNINRLFPVSTTMVIVRKNIMATDTTLIKINNKVLPISVKKLEILDDTIGSITAPITL